MLYTKKTSPEERCLLMMFIILMPVKLSQVICAHKFRNKNLVQDAHAMQSAIPGKRPNEPRAQ